MRGAASLRDELQTLMREIPRSQLRNALRPRVLPLAVDPSWRGFARGTSSSRARPRRGTRTARSRCRSARCPTRGDGIRRSYLPPIHPIGRAHRKGPNNALDAGPADPGRPWAIGAAEGGHTAIHPRARHARGFPALLVRPPRSVSRSRWRSTSRFSARPIIRTCSEHPRVVPHAARRHDSIRGESAEEVPGHLSVRLRDRRLAGAVGRADGASSVLDRAGRARSFASTIRTRSRSPFWEWLHRARSKREHPT